MYNLYQQIQDEVFSILPHSRRNNEYCRKLKYIDIKLYNLNAHKTYYTEYYYNQIIILMTKMSGTNKTINKKMDHPKGFKCGYDHSSERYCWVNFIPLLFDTRKSSYRIAGLKGHYSNPIQTIEFRPMQGTTDYKKLKSWLLICMGLVDIVENYKGYIYSNDGNYNLTSIINTCYSKTQIANDLNEYIESCKLKYKEKSIKIEELSQNETNKTENSEEIINENQENTLFQVEEICNIKLEDEDISDEIQNETVILNNSNKPKKIKVSEKRLAEGDTETRCIV